MTIHLRFYRDRGNMDVGYYTGDEDIRKHMKFDDPDDLRRCWKALVHDYEGEPYSAWAGRIGCDYLLCGGAFYPVCIREIEKEYYEALKMKGRRRHAN